MDIQFYKAGPVRLVRPRTLDFHSSNRGSNPLRDTILWRVLRSIVHAPGYPSASDPTIDFRGKPLKELVPACLSAPASEAFRSEMTG